MIPAVRPIVGRLELKKPWYEDPVLSFCAMQKFHLLRKTRWRFMNAEACISTPLIGRKEVGSRSSAFNSEPCWPLRPWLGIGSYQPNDTWLEARYPTGLGHETKGLAAHNFRESDHLPRSG